MVEAVHKIIYMAKHQLKQLPIEWDAPESFHLLVQTTLEHELAHDQLLSSKANGIAGENQMVTKYPKVV